MPFSPICDDPFNEESNSTAPGYTTNTMVEGEFSFEMVYTMGADLDEIEEAVDRALLTDLISEHVWCGKNYELDDARRLDSYSSMAITHPGEVLGFGIQTKSRSHDIDNVSNRRRQLLIDNVNMDGGNNIVSNDCQELSPSADDGTDCKIFNTQYTIYIRDDSDMEKEDAEEQVQDTIRDGMNPTMEDNIASQVDNVDEMYFHGSEYKARDNTIGKGEGVDGVKAGISGAGIAFISIGSMLTIVAVYAATRQKERHRYKRSVEFVEDDESLFAKGRGIPLYDDDDNNTDLMSRDAHVLGESDSQYSVDSQLYPFERDPGLGPDEDALGRTGSKLNVHHCTSATCQICSSKSRNGPTFVSSSFPLSMPEDEDADDYEKGDYVITDTVDLDQVTYSDTLDMSYARPRSYHAPNTIEM